MGLMKSYEYGSKKGNYWRVIALYPDTAYTTTKTKVVLYETKGARDKDESAYIVTMNYSLSGNIKTKDAAYIALKKHRDFDGAKDV